MPTMNAFDNGDVRTTILIIDGTRVGDVRVYNDSIIQTVISRWGTGGGNVPAIYPIQETNNNEKNGIAFDEWNDGAINTIHHTLRAAGKHSTGALQQNRIRRLTPIEAERLQGFPDDWTEGQADSHRYKQMGNAVTVNVARWIGTRL